MLKQLSVDIVTVFKKEAKKFVPTMSEKSFFLFLKDIISNQKQSIKAKVLVTTGNLMDNSLPLVRNGLVGFETTTTIH